MSMEKVIKGENPGKLIENIIENDFDLMVDKIKNELGYTVRQTVLTQLKDFKEFKGILETYIKYCKVFNYKVSFIIFNKKKEYRNSQLDIILENIRQDYNLTKEKFSKMKLNLSSYNYTYITFKRNTCQFQKINDIFKDKLGFNIIYVLTKVEV
ncbi:MAG: hypothetical protein AWU54_794 [Candidatus Frackibacter sp. T328-2]|nr:MAG: hypothetical protein AWU54_794 [Candidatus Frackibacter sp. T328-2]